MDLGSEKLEGDMRQEPGQAQAAGQDGGAQGEAAQSGEIAEALREKEQFKKLLQRVQADFINFRTRANEEAEQARRSGVRRLALRVVEVLDLFDAALASDAVAGMEPTWLEGVKAIQKSLTSALASEGIERFNPDGERFDPRRHEALMTTPTAEHTAGTVIRGLRPGYVYRGEVMRPAQVEVAVAPPDSAGGG